MELKETTLEDKLTETMARAIVAEKLAERAMDMAQKALIAVEAQAKSTHKVEYFNPIANEVNALLEEAAPATPVEPPKPQKISPFQAFGGFSARRASLAENAEGATPDTFFESDLDNV